MNHEEKNQPCKDDPKKPNECITCGVINFCPSPRTNEGYEWKKVMKGLDNNELQNN